MKQMLRTIVVMLTMLISTQAADAQTFSSMKEEQRNVELIKMARKLYQAEIGAPDKPCGEGVRMLTQNCCQTIHEERYVSDSFHLCSEAFNL